MYPRSCLFAPLPGLRLRITEQQFRSVFSCYDLHYKWTCVSAFTNSPSAFPIAGFYWQELDGFIADAKRFFRVYAHVCVVVCRVVENFAGRRMDCYVVSSDGSALPSAASASLAASLLPSLRRGANCRNSARPAVSSKWSYTTDCGRVSRRLQDFFFHTPQCGR